ncbi:alpha/beta hydrolase [Fibrisoma montanum]|uniref:Alpha/beta hydrolase n=1 Tax=Fibrisoma montanum TaxID=2305895 RepID=A0A418M406_9BACT|nr:alpha/beta fold hydrolase [Fibrisoma montanum]RIV20394.1 alpha/beta hydrolase [Fibrisoma montanum]
MPLIAPSSYQPPARLWNGHLQTIAPSLFRKVAVSYTRERIDTPDDDFLDLDWAEGSGHGAGGAGMLPTPEAPSPKPPLAILSHGLEGDTTRPYLAGMVRHLTRNGFDCLAWHYRSCSGELNRQARFYHIGETSDLDLVINYALDKGYTSVNLVGFSAGGNVTLKYLGERGDTVHPAIRRAVVFSVPLDLITATRRLETWDSLIYNYRFSRTLKRKVFEKAKVMPDKINIDGLRKARTVREFDDLITAPLHGFRDVTDYYTRNSSLQFVSKITVPTLIVNARNDPFLSPECFPEQLARELANVWMEFPQQGGHCGFPSKTGGLAGTYWSEERAVAFLKEA